MKEARERGARGREGNREETHTLRTIKYGQDIFDCSVFLTNNSIHTFLNTHVYILIVDYYYYYYLKKK